MASSAKGLILFIGAFIGALAQWRFIQKKLKSEQKDHLDKFDFLAYGFALLLAEIFLSSYPITFLGKSFQYQLLATFSFVSTVFCCTLGLLVCIDVIRAISANAKGVSFYRNYLMLASIEVMAILLMLCVRVFCWRV